MSGHHGRGLRRYARIVPREQVADMEVRCLKCGKNLDQGRLHKCPICFKYACEEHVYRMSGREFCSNSCAQYFFFGDEED